MMATMDQFPPGPPPTPPRDGYSSEGPPPEAPAAPYPPPSGGPNRVALIVIGVALIAGVGVGVLLARRGDDKPGAVTVPAGWTTRDTDDGFRIAIPPKWQELPPGDVEPALEEVRADNPELAELIENQLAGSLSDLVRYFAFDPESPSLAEGFATNVNVVVEGPLPSGIDFEQYLQANLTQLRQVPGVTVDIKDRSLSLPGGRSAWIVSRFTLNSPAGARQIDVNQYVFLKGNRGFILSMTTTPAHTATYASVFTQIARSFELL